MKRYLFTIGHDVITALSPEEVAATCRDLDELGLYHLPYPEVDIEFEGRDVIRWVDKDGNFSNCEGVVDGKSDMKLFCRFKGISLEENHPFSVWVIEPRSNHTEDITKYGGKDKETGELINPNLRRHLVASGLIALLATRNVVKTTKENKLGGLGIGCKKNPYTSVTTISLPKEMSDDTEHSPTGEHRRPHFRRGHIRRQHYGPAMAFEKKIWIEPVFVNADPDWVDKRERYNVG